MPIRLLVADDHGLLRAGLVALLNAETGMVVVGEAEDEHSVVSLTVEKKAGYCPDGYQYARFRWDRGHAADQTIGAGSKDPDPDRARR